MPRREVQPLGDASDGPLHAILADEAHPAAEKSAGRWPPSPFPSAKAEDQKRQRSPSSTAVMIATVTYTGRKPVERDGDDEGEPQHGIEEDRRSDALVRR